MTNHIKIVLASIVVFINTGLSDVHAQDKLELDTVTIKGNRELPKVLYIVPWKRMKNNDFDQKLVLHSLFKDAFDPIEPEAFERHVDNYGKYFGQQ